MEPACLIILASVCIQTQPLRIDVVTSPVGSGATIQARDYKAYVTLVTDEIGIEERPWRSVCASGYCLKFHVTRRTDAAGETSISYAFFEPSAREEQHLNISAKTSAGVRAAIQAFGVRVGNGKGVIPISQLAVE